MDKYDYIITGAGAAGLSLLMQMIDSGKFTGKQILLVDKEPKNRNDRTWCFWEKKPGPFDAIVYKRWNSMWFHDKLHSALHDIDPYQYKLIRGIDFYDYCFERIRPQANITVQYGRVEKCVSDAGGTFVLMDGREIKAQYIFNSVPFEKPDLPAGHHYLLQHFKGWIIETPSSLFNPGQATLMDFRVPQVNGDTTFVYVMPFSETRALVEFTVFSKQVLDDELYSRALREYCSEFLEVDNYSVVEEEFGVIPMTDYKFKRRVGNIINIGTAGGQTKPSSGYTFRFIQKHSGAIVKALMETGKPFVRAGLLNKRFDLYDHTLLNILARRSYPGEKIFSIMMSGNRMNEVFSFLDNETSFFQELKIIRQLPRGTFLKAALG